MKDHVKPCGCEGCAYVDWERFCRLTKKYVGGWFGLDKKPEFCPLKYKERRDEK